MTDVRAKLFWKQTPEEKFGSTQNDQARELVSTFVLVTSERGGLWNPEDVEDGPNAENELRVEGSPDQVQAAHVALTGLLAREVTLTPDPGPEA